MSYSTRTGPTTVGPRRRFDGRSVLALVLFLAIAYAVAGFGSLATISQVDGWYADAPKLAWSPPDWLFGPVWTLLHTLMAVAAWLVWRRRGLADVRSALWLYLAQLVLNAVWTPIFFGGFPLFGPAALWIALAVIMLLDVCVAATILVFAPISRTAAVLLVPYLAWLLSAATLNLGAAVLNS